MITLGYAELCTVCLEGVTIKEGVGDEHPVDGRVTTALAGAIDWISARVLYKTF